MGKGECKPRLNLLHSADRSQDSLPYLHDGRRLILEDTPEFFNLVLGLQL
jgi:hypothetical protein